MGKCLPMRCPQLVFKHSFTGCNPTHDACQSWPNVCRTNARAPIGGKQQAQIRAITIGGTDACLWARAEMCPCPREAPVAS